jgi:hypothetical protein
MAYGTIVADKITTSDGYTLGGTGATMKNRIINGAMVIDQRNAGASVTATGGGYTIDRWVSGSNQSSKYTVQQNAGSVTPPVGFSKYLGVTSSSAYSVTSGDYFFQEQDIEGFNVADLGWGTANAKTVTLSFWVRSSLTGTFGGALENNAQDRSYPFTYTISAANTWEQKSITIAGDTSGTWLTTNGVGIRVYFGLGVGSTYSGTAGSWSGNLYVSATGATSVVGTNGATFYLTGVQLEAGSTATSFDYRHYGNELALCQRYAYRVGADATAVYARFCAGFNDSTSNMNGCMHFPVPMRTAPSLTTTATASNYTINSGSSSVFTATAVPVVSPNATTATTANIGTNASGLTAGQGALLISNNNASAFLLFTAEL